MTENEEKRLQIIIARPLLTLTDEWHAFLLHMCANYEIHVSWEKKVLIIVSFSYTDAVASVNV